MKVYAEEWCKNVKVHSTSWNSTNEQWKAYKREKITQAKRQPSWQVIDFSRNKFTVVRFHKDSKLTINYYIQDS